MSFERLVGVVVWPVATTVVQRIDYPVASVAPPVAALVPLANSSAEVGSLLVVVLAPPLASGRHSCWTYSAEGYSAPASTPADPFVVAGCSYFD